MREQQLAPAAAPDVGVQKQFWNSWIADNLERESLDSLTLKPGETALRLLSGLQLSSPKILEVGCANGWLSAALAKFGQVTGVDLADEAIAVARARHPEAAFIAGDFLTAELPVGHFDVLVSLSVISFCVDQPQFVDRVFELLRPGGYLILTCPHRFIWDRTDFVRQSNGEIPLNWLNMGELKRLLRHRLSILQAETIIPAGNRGILRLINSYRLNKMIHKIVPEPSVIRLKEKMGLGRTLIVQAQKPATPPEHAALSATKR